MYKRNLLLFKQTQRYITRQKRDAIIDKTSKQQFKELYTEYKDIFLANPSDITKTRLVTMDINTGDSPPMSEKPFTLPLKHAAGLEKNWSY